MYSGLRTPIVPNATWAAVEGWDPVTGMFCSDDIIRTLTYGQAMALPSSRNW
jgi:hypothetical protein